MEAITYRYYQEKYCGNILNEEDFKRYEKKARRKLSSFTFGRIDCLQNIPDEVGDCICDIAEKISIAESKENFSGIVSESTDGHSVTFEKKQSIEQMNKELYLTAVDYLNNTGLLYGGVCLCSTARNW